MRRNYDSELTKVRVCVLAEDPSTGSGQSGGNDLLKKQKKQAKQLASFILFYLFTLNACPEPVEGSTMLLQHLRSFNFLIQYCDI